MHRKNILSGNIPLLMTCKTNNLCNLLTIYMTQTLVVTHSNFYPFDKCT